MHFCDGSEARINRCKNGLRTNPHMESSRFFWEGARPATARGAAPCRSHGCFEIGGSRQLAARSRSEAVPFGSDTGRAQCRNGRCPPHEIRASLLHNIGEKRWKALQKLMFAALGFTPLCRNHMKTVKKHRENEGPAHNPCIFTRRSAFRASHLQIYRFLLQYKRVFYMHFYDGSEMRINHCKNVWLFVFRPTMGLIF